MPKRIVICSDGTGNTGIKDRGTNVFKLFEAVDLESHRLDPSRTPQVAIYDDGVGTQAFAPLKIAAGATGWGLSRNVRHLYKELARVYDPGDEIYMFGFSRGAFTVRTLAGLIAACGLVDLNKLETRTFAGLKRAVRDAYAAYRACYRPWLWHAGGDPSTDAAHRFKATLAHDHEVRIRFLGVWDTVDAVGLPFFLGDLINIGVYRFKFPDSYLTPIVDCARHALAIDEQREAFRPVLWRERPGDRARIEQVWFAGSHSNVGGGYPKQGMSLVALDWMLSHAQRAGARFGQDGLRLNAADRDGLRSHASVDDKLYDSRAGLGVLYRWGIRDIAALCRAHGTAVKVHVSVLERLAHGTDDYAPGNIPADAEVVITEPVDTNKADQLVDHEASQLLHLRAAHSERVLRTIGPGSLLDTVSRVARVGRLAYYLYVLAAVVTIGDVVWVARHSEIPIPLIVSTVGVVAAAAALSAWKTARLAAVFSRTWFSKQQELREGLKTARAAASGCSTSSRPSHLARMRRRMVVS